MKQLFNNYYFVLFLLFDYIKKYFINSIYFLSSKVIFKLQNTMQTLDLCFVCHMQNPPLVKLDTKLCMFATL